MKTMKQTKYETTDGQFAAIVTRFKGSKEYSVSYFRGGSLKAYRVEECRKLSEAHFVAQAHVEVMQEQYCN